MPAAATINPNLVRILFDYDASSGHLIPKPTAARTARRINAKQWEITDVQYSVHRLIWAWHNPQDANPKYVGFNDGDRANTRIENLTSTSKNPRWVGHQKKRRARITADGMIMYEELMDQGLLGGA